MSNPKLFDLSLLQRALSPLPYVLLDNKIILLTSIETAEIGEDGSLMLCFHSGSELTLDPKESAMLTAALQEGIKNAIAAAARASMQPGNIVIDPFRRPQ